jgi:hypothetical protein
VYYDRNDLETGLVDDNEKLESFELELGVYPNPFNSSIIINWSHVEGGDDRIFIYDISGRLVKKLHVNSFQGGDKRAAWDATDNSGRRVSSGIYFVRVESGTNINTRKLLYLK